MYLVFSCEGLSIAFKSSETRKDSKIFPTVGKRKSSKMGRDDKTLTIIKTKKLSQYTEKNDARRYLPDSVLGNIEV